MGFYPIPLNNRQKSPTKKSWYEFKASPKTIVKNFNVGCNIGLLMGKDFQDGKVVCIDLDHPIAVKLAPLILPPTDCIVGREKQPKCHWFYQASENFITKHVSLTTIDPKETLSLFCVLGEKSQVVVGPSVHPSGDSYEFVQGTPSRVPAEDLRTALSKLLFEIKRELRSQGIQFEDEAIQSPRSLSPKPPPRTRHLPGDDYNKIYPGPLLERNNWVLQGTLDQIEYWRRPSKSSNYGHSATLTPFKDTWSFMNFSSAFPEITHKSLDPFGLLVQLEFGGNFKLAHKYLINEAQKPCAISTQLTTIPQKMAPIRASLKSEFIEDGDQKNKLVSTQKMNPQSINDLCLMKIGKIWSTEQIPNHKRGFEAVRVLKGFFHKPEEAITLLENTQFEEVSFLVDGHWEEIVDPDAPYWRLASEVADTWTHPKLSSWNLNTPTRRLAGIALKLQIKAGDNAFPMRQDLVAEVLGISQPVVSTLLRWLITRYHWLEFVGLEKITPKSPRKSNWYRCPQAWHLNEHDSPSDLPF